MSSLYTFQKVALLSSNRLSQDEEKELLKKYHAGDPLAYDKLRISLRPLVEKAINDVMPSGTSVSASNLRLRADTYLPKILQNYDINRGIKLNTYVINQLHGYLRNAVRENMTGPYVPRNQHDDLNRYRQAIRDAEMQYGSRPNEDQVRQFYPTDTANEFDKIKTYHVNSYLGDAVYGNEDDEEAMTFKEQFNNDNVITDDDLSADMLEEENEDLIQKKFTPHEQKIINMVTKQGQSFVQVSLSLGISTAEVRKVIRKWHKETQ